VAVKLQRRGRADELLEKLVEVRGVDPEHMAARLAG
jgi:hypothetical protein